MAHVLIVDDEVRVLRAVGSWVAAAGHEVTLATGGEEALRRVEEQAPDAALVDVMMPWMDGFDLLLQIRARFSPTELPVVLLIPQPADPDFRGFVGAATDYLIKPLSEPRVMAKLESIVARHDHSA
jgi:two-component system, OmpR family, response regulator